MASTLIPTAEIEELVQSGLPDRALERHIDAADASIISLYGPHSGERTVTLRGERHLRRRVGEVISGRAYAGSRSGRGYFIRGGEYRVHLPYPWAETVAEVKEYDENDDPADAETVDADDWTIDLDGRALRRLDRPWDTFVEVRYTPIDDTDKRVLLLADLVKLSTVYSATKITSVGPTGAGTSITHLEYKKEWRSLLHGMMPNRPGSTIA